MLQKHRTWVVGLLTFVASVSAGAAARVDERARIESVEGSKTALLQNGISLREASAGEEVKIGERIRTDAKTKVTLSYADGSQLVIYPNSDLEIEKPEGGIQSNQLRSGDVKGNVEKAKNVTADAKAKSKVKFIIRTKTAVMGVRGTEFVAAYNAVSGLSSFHTLTGVVEVASNPAQLLGGTGVSVGGGQFVHATEAGISGVQAFNPATFMSTLGSVGASAAASGDLAANAAASGVSAVVPDGSPNPPAPPPKLPPPPPPPALPPAAMEKKALEAEKEKPKMHLVSFSLAGFMSQNPRGETQVENPYYRALQVHWTPSIPVPVLNFLYVRGSFGATLFEHGSLNSAFLIHDYQVLAGTSLLNPLYAEVGGGHQSWRSDQISGAIMSGNIGLVISQNGRFNRLFAGASKFFNGVRPFEIRVGVGIQFF